VNYLLHFKKCKYQIIYYIQIHNIKYNIISNDYVSQRGHLLQLLSQVQVRERLLIISKVFTQNASQSSKLRRKKAWKPNRKARKMILGGDVALEDVARPALCRLVGRLTYPYLYKGSFLKWIEQQWITFMGYSPEFFHLSKGWLWVIYRTLEDATRH
jgi:hypothetical protein